MFNSIKKIIATLLVVGMNWSGLAAVFGTYAMFSDTETAAGNTFAAGILAFTATETALPNSNPCGEGQVSPAHGLSPAIDAYRRIDIGQTGTLDFNYSVSIINPVSSTTTVNVCDNLMVGDIVLGSYESSIPLVYSATSTLNLTFRLISDNPSLMNETCEFDYMIKAWQTNLAKDAGGFTNTQTIHSSVMADPWTVAEPESAPEQVSTPGLNSPVVILGISEEEKTESDGIGEEMEKMVQEQQTESPVELEEEVKDPVVDGGADPVEEVLEPETDAGGDDNGQGEGSGDAGGDAGSEGNEVSGE